MDFQGIAIDPLANVFAQWSGFIKSVKARFEILAPILLLTLQALKLLSHNFEYPHK